MAKKRYINTVFWNDSYVADLDPSEKLLYLYLITNPATNICGIYQVPLKRMATDTGIEKEMCQKIITRFQEDEKILYEDGWVAVRNFIKHQNINSPLILRGINSELENIPQFLIDFINIPDCVNITINKKKKFRTNLSQTKRKRILERDGYSCQMCGASGDGILLEIDHIIPIKQNGSNDDNNLRVLCRSCNNKRRNETTCDINMVSESASKSKSKSKSRSKSFLPPTLAEIQEYIKLNSLDVDAKFFLKYFTDGDWIDSRGNKVKNWKQKLLTWNKHNNGKPKQKEPVDLSGSK